MIPAMTDPLGRYWQQPADIRDAPMDEAHVLLTQHQFEALADYSDALPTSVFEGKCWKSSRLGRWYLCWYGAEPECADHWRLIEVVR